MKWETVGQCYCIRSFGNKKRIFSSYAIHCCTICAVKWKTLKAIVTVVKKKIESYSNRMWWQSRMWCEDSSFARFCRQKNCTQPITGQIWWIKLRQKALNVDSIKCYCYCYYHCLECSGKCNLAHSTFSPNITGRLSHSLQLLRYFRSNASPTVLV